MRFSIFQPFPYLTENPPRGSPVAPRHFDPKLAAESTRLNWEIIDLADQLGFDYVSVAEHHYTPRQLSPNPAVTAAALGQRLRQAKVAILGVTVPLRNPIAVAEELALVDVLTGGRLYVGLFRGVPIECTAYGTSPGESRAMYEEGVELILRAWTEPEPFAWEGRYYRFRNVAVWPQPLQRPTPPVLVAGNSRPSAEFAARLKLDLGLSYTSPAASAGLVTHYRQAATQHGWQPAASNVLWRGFVHVAESDEQAQEQCRRFGFGDIQGIAAPTPPQVAGTRAIMGDIMQSGWAGAPPPGPGPGVPHPAQNPAARPAGGRLPQLVGSPGTVARGLGELAEAGIGTADLIFLQDAMPFELGRRSLELFGAHVQPAFTAANSPAASPSAAQSATAG